MLQLQDIVITQRLGAQGREALEHFQFGTLLQIRGYPTLKLFHKGKAVPYQGADLYPSLLNPYAVANCL